MQHSTEMPMQLSFETPARHRDAVVIAGNAPYYKGGLLLARQLLEKEKDHKCDICVISSEPVETPAELTRGLRVGSVEFAETSYLKTDSRIPAEAYIRVFLAGQMPEYRRICYLDADIYLRRPGIQSLIDTDMEGKPLAAASDVAIWGPQRRDRSFDRYRHRIAKSPENYFNSGVLLIDVEKYNRALPAEDIPAKLAEHAPQLKLHDQSFLNMEFSHRVKHLNPIFNYPMIDPFSGMVDQADPILMHFIRPKPWDDSKGVVNRHYHPEYREFLSTHFGQTDFTPRAGTILPRSEVRKYKNPLREMLSVKMHERRIRHGPRKGARQWAEIQKRCAPK